jgi:cytochrome c-type biogenesis protein CcmH/NrfF
LYSLQVLPWQVIGKISFIIALNAQFVMAESDTEISKILRQEVKVMIDSGVSDEEILELLRNSYGNDIVSLEHELKPLNWFIMLVASAMLLMFAYLFFKSTESSQNIMHKKRRK